jgi:DNA-binding CsgD family transcriptional regulator
MIKVNCLILEPSYLIRKGLVSFFREYRQIGLIYDAEDINDADAFRKNNSIDIYVCTDDFADSLDPKEYQLRYVIKHDKKSDGDGVLNILKPKDVLVDQVQKDLEIFKSSKKSSDENLSGREIAVLALVAEGKTNKEIADQLFISVHTVMTHRKNITQKLGIKTVSGLTMYAIIHNIIETAAIK